MPYGFLADRIHAGTREGSMLSIIGHLIATAFRAFWRILITAVVTAAIGAGAVLAVIYRDTHHLQWPPRDQMTLVALVGVTALSAYAGGVTALMTEAVRALKEAAKVVEHEAVAPIEAVGRDLRGDTR
jgi:predicted lysophospholipase L1 biosynthesis ABC-type transport system permease subunit